MVIKKTWRCNIHGKIYVSKKKMEKYQINECIWKNKAKILHEKNITKWRKKKQKWCKIFVQAKNISLHIAF